MPMRRAKLKEFLAKWKYQVQEESKIAIRICILKLLFEALNRALEKTLEFIKENLRMPILP